MFLGFVTASQPPPPSSAPYGLNHARVVVEGIVSPVAQMFTDKVVPRGEPSKWSHYASIAIDGKLVVCGTEVGEIIGGQHILKKSTMAVKVSSA